MIAEVLAGLLGLVVGSFLNVVIYRVPRGESLLSPPSACPACGEAIRPRDNVPVLSFVLLAGRCRRCRTRIPIRYPLVELATAALFVGAVLRFPRLADAAFVAAASAVLIVLAGIDLAHWRVPNVIVLPAIAAAAAWVVVAGLTVGPRGAIASALGAGAVAFSLLFVIAVLSGGMGFGDVKLGAFIGIVTGWFGWGAFVLALFAGFTAGGIVAIALLATRRTSRKDSIPFAPMLCAGALVGMFVGGGPVRAWLGL